MAEDTKVEGTATVETKTAAETPANNASTSAGQGPSGAVTAAPQGDGEETVTLTQRQLNAMQAERRKTAAKQAVEELLAKLGVESADKLGELVAKSKEAEQAQLSETDKLRKRLAEAEAKAVAAEERATRRLLEASFVAEATTQGVRFPETALPLADMSGISVGEDGTVAGVREAIKALVDAGKLVMRETRPQAPSTDARAGGGGKPSDRSAMLTEDEAATAKRLGIKPEEYQKYKRA